MYPIQSTQTEFDALVVSFDGEGVANNAMRADKIARMIRCQGYDAELFLVHEPTNSAQPIGVYMHQADFQKYDGERIQKEAAAVEQKIREICQNTLDLGEYEEALIEWAREIIFQDQPQSPLKQSREIDYVHLRDWARSFGWSPEDVETVDLTTAEQLFNIPRSTLTYACRQKHIRAKLQGGAWHVQLKSLKQYAKTRLE